jgi:arylsulfatase B/arylsulfatase I/J
MVTAMDTIVGATVSALKETGMYNNSIIIYTSDNGGPAKMSNNLPLRGAKFSVFEGGIRVPAFVHSPLIGTQSTNRSTDELFYISDWYMTLAVSFFPLLLV